MRLASRALFFVWLIGFSEATSLVASVAIQKATDPQALKLQTEPAWVVGGAAITSASDLATVSPKDPKPDVVETDEEELPKKISLRIVGQSIIGGVIGAGIGYVAGQSLMGVSSAVADSLDHLQHAISGFLAGVYVGAYASDDNIRKILKETGTEFPADKNMLTLSTKDRLRLMFKYIEPSFMVGIVGGGLLLPFGVSSEPGGSSAVSSAGSSGGIADAGRGRDGPMLLKVMASMTIIQCAMAGVMGGAAAGYFSPEIEAYGEVLGQQIKKVAAKASEKFKALADDLDLKTLVSPENVEAMKMMAKKKLIEGAVAARTHAKKVHADIKTKIQDINVDDDIDRVKVAAQDAGHKVNNFAVEGGDRTADAARAISTKAGNLASEAHAQIAKSAEATADLAAKAHAHIVQSAAKAQDHIIQTAAKAQDELAKARDHIIQTAGNVRANIDQALDSENVRKHVQLASDKMLSVGDSIAQGASNIQQRAANLHANLSPLGGRISSALGNVLGDPKNEAERFLGNFRTLTTTSPVLRESAVENAVKRHGKP